MKLYKLFGSEPPEKEIFKSTTVRKHFADGHGVDWEGVDVVNKDRDHHRWFDVLEQQMAQKRPELLAIAARAYLKGVNETERDALVEQIKASAP